ncbi:MAG: aldo/keto reductase [Bacteroidetes bacterium]|nr:aldo/keto reductase [Bacteroidota bacterium]
MKYRKLGNSDLQVSEISFGCMSLGTDISVNTPIIEKAIESGMNLFDTADLYDKGANEEMLGKILKFHRKNIFIATKVGNQWKEDGSGWDWNPRKEYILSAVENSLQRLQTEYIDLYQLHGGTEEDNMDEVLEAFDVLKQQGKIRYYGISSIRPAVIKKYAATPKISSVMMQYSLLDRRPEEVCLPLLQEKGIGVLARGGLAKGLLIDKDSDTYLDHAAGEVTKAREAIHKIAGSAERMTAVALQFVLHQPAVSSAVVGIRTMEHLERALSAIESSLNEKDHLYLSDIIKASVYTAHR